MNGIGWECRIIGIFFYINCSTHHQLPELFCGECREFFVRLFVLGQWKNEGEWGKSSRYGGKFLGFSKWWDCVDRI